MSATRTHVFSLRHVSLNLMVSEPHLAYKEALALLLDPIVEGAMSPTRQISQVFCLLLSYYAAEEGHSCQVFSVLCENREHRLPVLSDSRVSLPPTPQALRTLS